MRIGLDARQVYRAQRRGIGNSLFELYRHLLDVRPDWHVVAYHRQRQWDGDVLPADRVEAKCIELPGDRFEAWAKWRLPMAARSDRVDVLHYPANFCPKWMPIPTIVTFHDLIPLDLPYQHGEAEVRRFRTSLELAGAKASVITCPSRYTADRLVRDYTVPSQLVRVHPWGAERKGETFTAGAIRKVMERYRIGKRIVLHFGSGQPRKNTAGVIEAWARIRRRSKSVWQLLIVGLEGDGHHEFGRMISRLGIEQQVRLHGFVDPDDMPLLMEMADVLAYPSFSEGFGLPVLEAFATDTAVLTSDITSMPEVAGDAALLVDPRQPAAIARGLSRLMSDSHLRYQLVMKGRARLEQFTWRRCAEQFAEAVESIGEPAGAAAAGQLAA